MAGSLISLHRPARRIAQRLEVPAEAAWRSRLEPLIHELAHWRVLNPRAHLFRYFDTVLAEQLNVMPAWRADWQEAAAITVEILVFQMLGVDLTKWDRAGDLLRYAAASLRITRSSNREWMESFVAEHIASRRMLRVAELVVQDFVNA